jgi:hypothetical protein
MAGSDDKKKDQREALLPAEDKSNGSAAAQPSDGKFDPVDSKGQVGADAKAELVVANVPEANPTLVKFFDGTGSVLTFLAMVPQGIFGGLLAYKFTKEELGEGTWEEAVALTALGIFGIASFEGKRRLVRSYNRNAFKDLAELELKDFDLRRFSKIELIIGIINIYAIYVASKTFAGLAFLGLKDIGELILRDYFHWDKVAEVVEHLATGALFAIPAFLANIFAFRAIHTYGTGLLISGLEYLLEDPAYRRERQLLEQKMQWFRISLRDNAEKDDWAAYNDLIRELQSTEGAKRLFSDNDQNVAPINLALVSASDLKKFIIKTPFGNYQPQALPGWKTFIPLHLSATVFSAIAIYGLFNFTDMTDATNDELGMSVMSPLERWTDYAFSMALLALNSVYLSVVSLFAGNRNLNFATKCRYAINIIFTILTCVLGGMPNAYQSILAKENFWMLMFAFTSSALIEAGGVYDLTNDGTNDAICAAEPDKGIAMENDKYLRKLEDLVNTGEKEVNELIELREAAAAKQQAPAQNNGGPEEHKVIAGPRAKIKKWRDGATPFWRKSTPPPPAGPVEVAADAAAAPPSGAPVHNR